MDLNQPVVVRGSRLTGFGPFLVLLAMGAVWAIADGDRGVELDPNEATQWLFVFALVGSGLGALGEALFPVTLAFGPQGVSWGRFGKRRRLAWRDVGAFKVVRGRVGFDYADAYRPHERQGRVFDRANWGSEGDLPRGLTIEAHELASRLNRARERWAA